ncbi:hypothetical protein WICPIJ_009466 [Wickerhamomyces pijperi]|uniref:Uncharacterized protein n=1 Tax=Wickerhamomyces pijperi TaxID=599730 RepID=A0A9P8TCV0_WICPI|nr:hypothetical protein WICPIJ_009466 [Wickerhamomyces pijperi]
MFLIWASSLTEGKITESPKNSSNSASSASGSLALLSSASSMFKSSSSSSVMNGKKARMSFQLLQNGLVVVMQGLGFNGVLGMIIRNDGQFGKFRKDDQRIIVVGDLTVGYRLYPKDFPVQFELIDKDQLILLIDLENL